VSVANSFRAAAVEPSTTGGAMLSVVGVGPSPAARTAATGPTVNSAAVGAATTMGFTTAGMAMPTTVRTATMGPAVRTAAMRTMSAMLTEGWFRAAHEYERNKRCKQEAYG
jgi:hypothetical protein